MIKAVFLDWLNTIAHPEPERHRLLLLAAREVGVELPPDKLPRAIQIAESAEPRGAPPRWRDGADEAPFLRYQRALAAELGIVLSEDAMMSLVRRVAKGARRVEWVYYEDVIPTLKELKRRGLKLGLISNLIMGEAGLDDYLDVVATAGEVGMPKPQPPIFLAALERAGVNALEAIYVGDQYATDVIGARGVGMKPILIDRYGVMPDVEDCPRISGLDELFAYL